MVKYIETDAEFQELMEQSSSKLVVIDFTATWCGPCQMIAPVFEKMSDEFTDVIFIKVDVDKADTIAQKCGIKAMPTFQYYKDGKKVDEICGADAAKIKSKVLEHK
uniref:Thioredoxin n=1 Tax=Eucampia antarctica TaxID=49252 RepID=A0A7S2WLZ4_9STRA|mmetsp:Transcript_6178/g.5782  ORF Transcript_6178/g.5782 Transcript_6178/m.5782 type:complete len:106 (+) Transcript_6178:100-417(+)|eukprot:CAMPEP_0197840676 /NCGR_PEP_ID=MMETSP1437-20131217/45741_1 /TAXON_ID=49252 ORGANISM="Eucampia antarctica, Strain CCMP1452" /NCGR_SAMPLE_ID=MMETSP1437 /ASSEMBLY_ACC=CAM_ASM_001096 /LENGTH=105 /DNA_ID=CAMNT_0043450317 /DNA_START=82 /DNA_END=402 /DNA_ORIENTATION=+